MPRCQPDIAFQTQTSPQTVVSILTQHLTDTFKEWKYYSDLWEDF